MNITIITACPSGVANSIIAAGLLEKAAKELGWSAAIECQSSVLPESPVSQDAIDSSDVVVIAANTNVDKTRFVGKKVYQAAISECTADAKAFLEKAVPEATVLDASQVESTVEVTGTSPATGSKRSLRLLLVQRVLHIPSWQQKRLKQKANA